MKYSHRRVRERAFRMHSELQKKTRIPLKAIANFETEIIVSEILNQ